MNTVSAPIKRRCVKCHKDKDDREFYRRDTGILRRECKICAHKRGAEWAKANRDRKNKTSREWAAKNKNYRRIKTLIGHGLTQEEYEKLFQKQNGLCAICRNQEDPAYKKKYLSIDHDHKSGIVRGLLCHKCNIGIGMFEDDPDRMASALKYLKK